MGTLRKLGLRFLYCFFFCAAASLLSPPPVAALRPLRERARSWGDEWLFVRKDENELGPFSTWNITGTYRGTWKFPDSANSSSRFLEFRKSSGNSVIELVSTQTKITGVHYVQLEEEKSLKHMRRTMVPHARPVPNFEHPFCPQKCPRETTKAKSPNLRVQQRQERRRMMLKSATSSAAAHMR